MIVYMSIIGNTQKLIDKIGLNSLRLRGGEGLVVIDKPFLAIVPTYDKETLQPFWTLFENPVNVKNCIGLIGAGNLNFAKAFCHSAKGLSKAFNIPLVHTLEFQGNAVDVKLIQQLIKENNESD